MTDQLMPVPTNSSALEAIKPTLDRVITKLYDDLPIQHDLAMVEKFLGERRALIDAKHFDPSFDWQSDLATAETHFKIAIEWAPRHKETRDGYITYWRGRLERNERNLNEISINGLKTILLVHGAVAVGALNILKDAASSATILMISRWALSFSVLGIVMYGVGVVIMIEVMGTLNEKMIGAISTKLPWRRVRALSRYFRRGARPLSYATQLIYGSVIWFAVYSIVLLILLTA